MSIGMLGSSLFRDMFGTAAMREAFGELAFLARCTEVEAALARAQARLGIIPAEAAAAIAKAATVDRVDFAELGASVEIVGYPVVGLVKALGRAAGTEAARYVHWGATTQDIVDTGLVLQMRQGI